MGSDAMKAFTAITADHGVLGALEGDSSLGGRADRVDLSDWGWGGDYERRGRKSEESDSGRELHCCIVPDTGSGTVALVLSSTLLS
ncbi:MAG: hypothetical protein MMC23_009820 [Stictis urceolatum]|nr:hypothetical protein [Stictis urceolata]